MNSPLTLLFLIAALPALAEETRTFRTLCTGHARGVETIHLKLPGRETLLEAPLYTEVLSLPEPLPGVKPGDTLVFTPGADAPSDAVASITLPDSQSVLFLFVPAGRAAKAPYRVVALEDDVKAFPWHRIKLVNLSPNDARFELGEFSGKAAVDLAPGKTALLGPVRKLNHLNAFDAKVLASRNGNTFVPVHHSRWRSVAAKRDLVLVLPGRAGKPEVRLFEDVMPAEIP